ncbi:hypothetical protein [Spiroplasma attinicola]|uniref:hypothetical protein n=1 Tax=Spiroplasma attinicola TaxID=2904537 RepID=UPI002022AFDA|nr:hypothetical protein [Spiroplasma sp. JKS002670]MCL8209899.1 hypothetical protein [Spiroplasma sp. JKS002670]
MLFSEAFADWNSKNNKEMVYEIFIFSNILYCIKGCIEAIFSSFEKLKLITKFDSKKIKSDLATLHLMKIRKVVTHSTHAKFDNEIEYYLFRNPLNNDELNTLPRFIYKLSNNNLEKVYFKMNFVTESIKKFKFFLEEIKNILNKKM